MRWADHVACMKVMSNTYTFMFGKPEGKRPQGRPRRRRENNIKMDIKEV
jgi:hypothetical protein